MKSRLVGQFVWLVGLAMACAGLRGATIELDVDARQAAQQLLKARLKIPATAGPMTLVYPKWIPGEHGPSGPIVDLAGLKVTAGGQSIPWRRDPAEMYFLHVDVPSGAESVEVSLEFLLPPAGDGFSSAGSSTEKLLLLSWNQVLLYPKTERAIDLQYAAKVRLPEGWKYGSALPGGRPAGEGIQFDPVTLETLVDSPLIAGQYFRTFSLGSNGERVQEIVAAADSASALEMGEGHQNQFSKLMVEAQELFGAVHYNEYKFLLTMSDHVAHFGLEHHQSSDNRTPERMLVDEDLRRWWAGLLPHELVHSWNGKFRRPADLATVNFHEPMRSDLLWVYEGLTTYLGDVLAVRSGLMKAEDYRQAVAMDAARLSLQRGRDWRPLVDTAVAAQILYNSRADGSAARRGVDFYPEGALIWLEADVVIRTLSRGEKSLDNFCRKFFGGENSGPRVMTYTEDEVYRVLNEIVSADWPKFFADRVKSVNVKAPLGGLEKGGWKLVYRDEPSSYLKVAESVNKTVDLTYSIGMLVKEDGTVIDVIPGMSAARSGIGPTMKVVAVNGRRWNEQRMRAAVQRSKQTKIELIVENSEYIRPVTLTYAEGEKYPHLERDDTRADLLQKILE